MDLIQETFCQAKKPLNPGAIYSKRPMLYIQKINFTRQDYIIIKALLP